MGVKIFVEGGGEGGASVTKLRKGFEAFFGKMLEGRDKPSISPGGGRTATFRLFAGFLPRLGVGDYAILLVDSEGPIARNTDPWEYLRARDGWEKPRQATDDDVHLMVQCIENWFLGDVPKLTEYYGAGFKPEKLPKPVGKARRESDVECHDKAKVFQSLNAALKDCRRDGYQKSDAFEIIARIDPAKVCKVAFFATRLRDRLVGISPERR